VLLRSNLSFTAGPQTNPPAHALPTTRYTSGALTKCDIALALKIATQQLLEDAQSGRPVALDLGPGTLSIRGRLAEFRFARGSVVTAASSRAGSVVSAAPSAAPASRARSAVGGGGQQVTAAPASRAGSSVRLTPEVLSRLEAASAASARSSAVGKSRVAPASGAAGSAAARQQQQGSVVGSKVASAVSRARGPSAEQQQQSHQGTEETAAAAAAAAAAGATGRLRKTSKPSVVLPPGATPLPGPAAMLQSIRAAREAAKANARSRVATFVLPCGGPKDEEPPAAAAGSATSLPQGRGKPPQSGGGAAAQMYGILGGGGSPASDGKLAAADAATGAGAQTAVQGQPKPPKQEVKAGVKAALEAAERRAAAERERRAQADAAALGAMLARKAALDAEAEGIREELQKKKKLLAVSKCLDPLGVFGWTGLPVISGWPQLTHHSLLRPVDRTEHAGVAGSGEADCCCEREDGNQRVICLQWDEMT
jgi:hypothetical protein